MIGLFPLSPDMIKMATGEVPIHISNKNPKTFTSTNYNTFNRATLAKQNNKAVSSWDMVIVSLLAGRSGSVRR